MLQVDLGRLDREWKFPFEAELAPDAAIWEGGEVRLAAPMQVRGEVQQVGNDVLVRGDFQGVAALECRRCLRPLEVPVEEEFTLLFRPGIDPAEAQEEDVYPLPERGTELDLTEPLREQVMLSVPRFAICEEACRGLCPRCGANLNDRDCDCKAEEEDPRWDALRNLKLD